MNITLNQLSDQIWEFAETGFLETKSCHAMCQYLENAGFVVTKGIAGMETAYKGIWGSGKPVITFLAEYDALFGMSQKADLFEYAPLGSNENPGHGCGHHLLGVGAIAAAVEYRDYLKNHQLEGTVQILGCPAEESGSGKAYLARDGYLDDTDIALTWHPGQFNQVHTGSSQSCISVNFRFHGISSHAAGSPHLGRSALDACELMNVGVNYLREHMESTDRVHYAYLNVGGKAPNVVQSEAELKYFIRSTNNPKALKLYDRVINIAKGAAMMTETSVDVLFDEGLSNTIPNFVIEDILENAFHKVLSPIYTEEELAYAENFKNTTPLERINIPQKALDKEAIKKIISSQSIHSGFMKCAHSEECGMGSTDVGDISWVVPTGQINTACFAIGAGSHSWQWVAQGKSSIAHKGMQYAGKILAQAAIEFHSNPELIQKAKDEFNQRLGQDVYQCLIPKDVKPHLID